MNTTVDKLFNKPSRWHDELLSLRDIVLQTELIEEMKWGQPCYTLNGANVIIIHGFKEYCALLFFKGALMDDKAGILIQQTENVQSARQIRFTGIEQIETQRDILLEYIKNAINLEKSGKKVDFKQKTDLIFPTELQTLFDGDPEFKAAFNALTPGRQRAYNLYFTAPKQTKTRQARIEKYMGQILNGKGMHD